jgi:polysaccharide export outer membrane protein
MMRILLGAAMVAGSFFPLGAKAQQALDVGDSLQVTVAGVPELSQRGTIASDGHVSLPLVGPVYVKGLTLPEVQAKLQEELPTKSLRLRTVDGRLAVVVVEPHQITVDIAEYRPVYLMGDVAAPGDKPFRPGMTVRQAVTLAGGYDVMRLRMNNPFLEIADLQSEYTNLWTEYTKAQSQVLRLESEASGKTAIDQRELTNSPLPATVISEISKLELEQLSARLANVEKDKVWLRHSIEDANQLIAALTDSRLRDDDDSRLTAENLERLQELHQKGIISGPRVNEERRQVLNQRIRVSQNTAQTQEMKIRRDELVRKLQRIDDERRINVTAELQDAKVRVAMVSTKLQSVGEKLLYTGAVKSQLVRGKGGRPEIVIFRKGERGRDRIVASEDTEVTPGDVIEVALRSELIDGARPQGSDARSDVELSVKSAKK